MDAKDRAFSSLSLVQLGKISSIIFGALVLIGGFHLRSYLSSWGVPFPFELGDLAAVMLMFGLTSLLITVLFLFIVILTSGIKNELFKIDYLELTSIDQHGQFSHIEKIKSTIFLILFPTLLSIISIFYFRPSFPFKSEFGNSLLISYLLLLYSSGWIALSKEKANENIIKRLAFIISIQSASFVSWLLIIIVPITIGLVDNDSELAQPISIAVSVILATILLYPFGNPQGNSSWEQKNIGTIFIITCLVTSTLMPNVSSYIGKETLRFFATGGEIEQTIYFPEDKISQAPKKLVSHVNEFTIKSESKETAPKQQKYAVALNADLIFKSGDYSYYKRDELVFRLNTKDLVIISAFRNPTFLKN